MPSFRDLRPEAPDPDDLPPPRQREIKGETVDEALARGVRIQVLPTVRRDPGEPVDQRPRWGNDGFAAKRARRRRKPKGASE